MNSAILCELTSFGRFFLFNLDRFREGLFSARRTVSSGDPIECVISWWSKTMLSWGAGDQLRCRPVAAAMTNRELESRRPDFFFVGSPRSSISTGRVGQDFPFDRLRTKEKTKTTTMTKKHSWAGRRERQSVVNSSDYLRLQKVCRVTVVLIGRLRCCWQLDRINDISPI